MEPIETREVRGFTANLYYDDDAESPRTSMDNAWEWYGGPGYHYGLDGMSYRYGPDDYWTVGEWLGSAVGRSAGDSVVFLHVNRYGIGRVDDPNAANVVAVLRADTLAKEWPGDRTAAYRCLDGEIDTYNSFVRGEVYQWTVTGPDGEYVDGCGGYLGYDDTDDVMRAAIDTANHYADERDRENLMRGLAQVGVGKLYV